MKRAHVKSLMQLLLALVALRGLVPAGYMIGVTERGLSLVVCESGIYKDAMPHHDGALHHQKDSHGGHDHSICPFAVAAAGAPAPNVVTLATAVEVAIDRNRDSNIVVAGSFGPSRAQRSRAPPFFA